MDKREIWQFAKILAVRESDLKGLNEYLLRKIYDRINAFQTQIEGLKKEINELEADNTFKHSQIKNQLKYIKELESRLNQQ